MSDQRPPGAAATDARADSVRGERAAAIVSAARSLQSRASSLLAAALMIGIGVAALTWYYAHTFAHPARSRQSAQATAASRAQAEMTLPSLGAVVPPVAAAPPGRSLRWIVDDGGTQCPDCDDNALAGPLRSGETFPTGHACPPAHAGCRCLLAPAEA